MDMFKCMVQYLFDEYKYFARYPERHLLITGILFGALIQHQIVTSMALGIALRYVLEALRQPSNTLLFKFGIHALAQFQSRLAEWPQYCSLLLQIEHLHQSTPEIIRYIKSMPAQPAVDTTDLGAVSTSPQFDDGNIFSALSLDGILRGMDLNGFVDPEEQIQDKILFIINNLSFSNLEAKVPEILEILLPQHSRWFSHYIVVKRASIEPNFHSLYVAFIDTLKMPQVEQIVLHETLSEIRDLLNSEKTLNSSQERSLLKNLGTWLGSITLAKNKPIRHSNLAFKELLLQGYDSKRLIVVIPFICKVLEQCTSSKVFKPPNPWLMAIMRLLAELYHFAELKLNLKFEVEVLCKNIKLDIKDVAPSELLRVRRRDERSPQSAKPAADFSAEEEGVGFANLASFITFNPNISIFNTRPSLKRIVQIAIDRSIREVIQSPVVERSATIAVIATRELSLKDFALEPNEEKMRKAAQYMVQSLSGSLASVSSREPLRISMIANLKNLLLQNGFTEQTVPEQVVYVIVSDNLDLACSFMEKAAAEKSIQEIDDSLSVAYNNRRKHRERSTQPYYDLAVYAASRYPSALPDQLRLRPGGLTQPQMMVYEDFTRVPHSLTVGSAEKPRPREVEAPLVYDEATASLTNIKVFEKFLLVISELEQFVSENPTGTLAALSNQPDAQSNMQQIIWLVSKATNVEDVALVFAQKIIQLLYKSPSIASNEVYIWLLIKLIETSPKLLKDIKEWLLYQDDERKCDTTVTISLMRAELLNVHELDMQLARSMETGKTHTTSFTISLIRTCVIEEKLCSYTDFVHSVECLSRLQQKGKGVDGMNAILKDLSQNAATFKIKQLLAAKGEANKAQLKEHLELLFREWVQIYYHPGSSEKTQTLFVGQMISEGFLKNDNNVQLFFRLACEACVETFGQTAQPTAIFSQIDALVRLVLLLVINSSDTAVVRVNLVSRALAVFSLVLVHYHESTTQQFNQKPFFRIFSTLLNDLKTYQDKISDTYLQLVSAVR
jgi:CCR4-NOT transcription complex subunit 1